MTIPLTFEAYPIVAPMFIAIHGPGHTIRIGHQTIAATNNRTHAIRICELLNQHGLLAVPDFVETEVGE